MKTFIQDFQQKKIYLYKIHNRDTNSHLLSKRAWFVPQKISLIKMKRASNILLGNMTLMLLDHLAVRQRKL